MLHPSFKTASQLILIGFLYTHAHSRHIHRRHVHQHLHRAEVPLPNVTSCISPSPTSANAVAEDIENLSQGLSTLSDDILSFMSLLGQRRQQLEGLLASLLSSSSSSSSTDSPPTPLTTSTTESLATTDTMRVSSQAIAATAAILSSMSTLCNAQDSGCSQMSETTTLTSTSFITLTRYTSITLDLSVSSSTNPSSASSAITISIVNAGVTGTTAPPSPSNPSIYYPATFTSTATPNMTVTQAYDSAITTYVTTLSSSITQTVTSVTEVQTVLPTASPYTFNPQARDNVAVYYGAGPVAPIGGLLTLCENPNVDIVMLAFLTQYFGPEGSPTLVIEGGCSPANTAQSKAAPGLTDCTELATEIVGCQQIGKPVLLSLGGYLSNTSFISDNQAEKFSETLWNLFGGGTQDQDLRPFGNVTLDGFDIDTEQKNPDHYEYFATSLRKQFALDPNNKTYYISAAPQCVRPDASIPIGAMMQADFVWVQFYNNPICNLNTTAFPDSFAAWSKDLTPPSNSTTGTGPRLFIGAPGFSGAGSGYVPGADLRIYTGPATDLYVENLGGVMLWDGPSAMANVDQSGGSYLEYAKRALQ